VLVLLVVVLVVQVLVLDPEHKPKSTKNLEAIFLEPF
jgi:hypothetical protein